MVGFALVPAHACLCPHLCRMAEDRLTGGNVAIKKIMDVVADGAKLSDTMYACHCLARRAGGSVLPSVFPSLGRSARVCVCAVSSNRRVLREIKLLKHFKHDNVRF